MLHIMNHELYTINHKYDFELLNQSKIQNAHESAKEYSERLTIFIAICADLYQRALGKNAKHNGFMYQYKQSARWT